MPKNQHLGRGLSLVALLAAQGAARSAEAAPLDIPFEKYRLENGLTVILHQDRRLPLVAVSVWYDVGALHERAGRSGFAHLFEHMMFQASKHVGEDKHFAYLQEAGATRMNGTTANDRTNYFQTVPRHELDLALWLESDRMGFLLPALTQASLVNQIEVVKNERRQSVENRPYGLMEELIVQTLYPKPHPYYGNVIGSMEDLSAATLQDVRDFFLTYYSPANATLTLAGDFAIEEAKQKIEKYFGPLRGRSKPLPVKLDAPALKEDMRLDFAEPVGNLPKIVFAWMGPSAYQKDTAELDLLSHVISGTKSSRLDKKVSYEQQIAQSVTARLEENASGSVFRIELVAGPGRTLDEAEKAITEVLASLEKEPPTEAELQRAKNAQETRLVQELEILGGFSGRAERLQTYQHYLGDPGKIAWDLERYQKVTTADLSRVAAAYLRGKKLIVRASPAVKGSQP